MKRLLTCFAIGILLLVVVSCAAAPTPTPTPKPTVPAATQALATKVPPTAVPATATPSKKFQMALVPPALVSPFYIVLADTVKSIAAKNPYIELTVMAPTAQTAIEEQVKIIEDMTQKKVDLIAIASSNWEAITPSLQKARQAGIEVVLVDRVAPLEGLDAISGLGSDEIEGGEFVGDFVNKAFKGKAKIAILSGVVGSYHAERRMLGFMNKTINVPGIQKVANQPANWDRGVGMSTAENILQAQKDLDVIWGQNDNMALGAMTAVEAAKRQDKVKVIGYNGDKEALEMVKAGRMLATFKSQPVKIAEAIMNEIVPSLMAGKRAQVKPAYPIHVVPVTKDNVDQFLQ